MPGMDQGDMAKDDGLADAKHGYRLVSDIKELPAGKPAGHAFTITGPDGNPATGLGLDQTKRMHFYAMRSDLIGFQHLHPTGKPVTDLQPYLDTYAHLTAFHEGDQAVAHLHPENKVTTAGGGLDLSIHAQLDKPGNCRLFLQFQTDGKLHTAALTLRAS
ncbi:hypothetical protein ACFWP3_36460 [Streptomyces sp. NPDC058525]|uniref:hypothetical protein n=1 Tax=Streptomyces sp. NPDC058525 TaxID=3346538 RepID=UPI00365C997F